MGLDGAPASGGLCFAAGVKPADTAGAGRNMSVQIESEATPFREPEFWSRQFSDSVTKNQMKFDIIFGVVLPLLCLVFDPSVFKGLYHGRVYLGHYKIFFYGAIAIQIPVFCLWLALGRRLGPALGFVAGTLLAGASISLIVGIAILPLSVSGLRLLMIGSLGFIPFFTGFTFFRNFRRAYKCAKAKIPAPLVLSSMIVAVAIALGPPAAVNLRVSRLVQQVVEGDSEAAVAAGKSLRKWKNLAELDTIVLAYEKEDDPARVEALRDIYEDIAEVDINWRALALRDGPHMATLYFPDHIKRRDDHGD